MQHAQHNAGIFPARLRQHTADAIIVLTHVASIAATVMQSMTSLAVIVRHDTGTVKFGVAGGSLSMDTFECGEGQCMLDQPMSLQCSLLLWEQV